MKSSNSDDILAGILYTKAAAAIKAGQPEAARALLEEAVSLQPSNIEALRRLGEICSTLQDHEAAVVHLQTLMAAEPEDLEILFSLAVELYFTARYADAVELLEKTLHREPGLPVVHRYLGMSYAQLGKQEAAMQHYREALRFMPTDVMTIVEAANLLLKHTRLKEAEKLLQQGLRLEPENAAVLNAIARMRKLQGRIVEAVSTFRQARALDQDNRMLANNLLFTLIYDPHQSPEEVAAEHKLVAAHNYPYLSGTTFPKIQIGQKLKIGYLSGDFFTHSVSYYLEPVLTHHDRRAFELHCYSNLTQPDETTRRLKQLADGWHDIYHLSDRAAAKRIAADGIDILVDLSGHTSQNRLGICARKPAPVQATWLGYPHSTGLQQIDYYLSDSLCDPPGMTDHLYSERLWRLPRIFSCYAPPLEFPPVTPSPFERDGTITFGSFNNFAKVNPPLISLWVEILRQVPRSRLYLKSISLGDSATKEHVLSQFVAGGIAADRILLRTITPSGQQHLAQYAEVDIALDTFPYNGTTTTCEALWMGVPVITLAGKVHASRVGLSFLYNIGCPELVAETPDHYVATAVALAQDVNRLKILRQDLRSLLAHSPLMDAAGVTREVEQAYLSMIAANH